MHCTVNRHKFVRMYKHAAVRITRDLLNSLYVYIYIYILRQQFWALCLTNSPETKPYISKQRYKAVKNNDCIHTAELFDSKVMVAALTNTIDIHSGSQ